MSDGAELRCAGRLFHRLAAETGKARMPTVVRMKYGTISLSELDHRSLDRDGTSVTLDVQIKLDLGRLPVGFRPTLYIA